MGVHENALIEEGTRDDLIKALKKAWTEIEIRSRAMDKYSPCGDHNGKAPGGCLMCEYDAVKRENEILRRARDVDGDTFGDSLDNQAWVMMSHIAARLAEAVDDPRLMEKWQDAWAKGIVQQGYFTPNRGAAAWIARHCVGFIRAAASEKRDTQNG